jgi:hypothetical protein
MTVADMMLVRANWVSNGELCGLYAKRTNHYGVHAMYILAKYNSIQVI